MLFRRGQQPQLFLLRQGILGHDALRAALAIAELPVPRQLPEGRLRDGKGGFFPAPPQGFLPLFLPIGPPILAAQQLIGADAVEPGQGQNEEEFRIAFVRLPLAHRLGAHPQLCRRFLLAERAFQPQVPEAGAECAHFAHLLFSFFHTIF